QWYLRALGWSLRHRGFVAGGAIASFAAGLALVPLIPKGFVPHLDRGTFIVFATVAHPGAHPAAEAIRAANIFDATIRRDADVANVLASAGDRGDPAVATLTVALRDDRRSRTFDVQNRVRAGLPRVAGVVTSVEDVPFVDNGVAKPLSVVIADADLGTLARAARQLADALRRERGFVDVTAAGLDGNPRAPAKITHEKRRRVMDVQADLAGLSVGDATARVERPDRLAAGRIDRG
ncbi:MAG: efflux RND transporter permease subunit, partial [Candidatus Velthaea sp.]